MSFDVSRVRADFPILSRQVNGRPLVYLDSGASAQKPQVVIDAINAYYLGAGALTMPRYVAATRSGSDNRVSEIDGDFFSSSARSARTGFTSWAARPGGRSGTRDSTISRSRSAEG